MKILFASNFYGEYYFQAMMADALRVAGVEAVFVTRPLIPEDPRTIPWSTLYGAVDRESIRRELTDEVDRIESMYDVRLPRIISSDRLLPLKPEREGLVGAVAHFQMWERYFREHPVDAYFWFCDGDVLYRSAHYVARGLGIPSFNRVPGPIPNSHAWLDNEFDLWDDFEDRPIEEIPADELTWARDYLQGVRDRRISLMQLRNPTANFIDHKVFQFLEHVWMKATRERRNPVWRPFLWARQYLAKVWRERGERRLYRAPNLEAPYILFPLQKPGDIQLTVRAPQFDLEAVAQRVVDIAPKGWRVVIKGHPTWVGTYPVAMYRRLMSRGNVDVVPAGYDVLQLIRHARAVVTVNNTVGYEAVLMRRPVVTMTPTYYSRYSHVARSIENLERTLTYALEEGFTHSDEEIERFVANLRAATFSGKAHFILNEKNELLTRRDIARTRQAYRRHAEDHGRSILAKLQRVRARRRAPLVTT